MSQNGLVSVNQCEQTHTSDSKTRIAYLTLSTCGGKKHVDAYNIQSNVSTSGHCCMNRDEDVSHFGLYSELLSLGRSETGNHFF